MGRLPALVFLAATTCCAAPPTSICDMPSNRHFWQGLEVSWRGEIIDVAGGHGHGIYFTEFECGRLVSLDRDAVWQLYQPGNYGHAAVASYAVQGQLTFKNNQIVIRPNRMHRLSPWATNDDDGFRNYMAKRRSAAIEQGSLKPETPQPKAP